MTKINDHTHRMNTPTRKSSANCWDFESPKYKRANQAPKKSMYYNDNQENEYDNFYADTTDYDAHCAQIENIKIS